MTDMNILLKLPITKSAWHNADVGAFEREPTPPLSVSDQIHYLKFGNVIQIHGIHVYVL